MKLTLEILEERIKAINLAAKLKAKALKIQAKEYKRRLKDLNGEASRLREIQAEYIPREVFDRTVSNLMERIETLTSWKTKQEGRNQLIIWVPWIIAAIAIIANWFKK